MNPAVLATPNPTRHWLMPFFVVIVLMALFDVSAYFNLGGIFRSYAWFFPKVYYYFCMMYFLSRGWTPDTFIAPGHMKFLAIGLAGTVVDVTLFALLGFSDTYRDATSALYLALATIPFLLLILFLTSPCGDKSQMKIPIWIYFVCAPIAFVIWPDFGSTWPEDSVMQVAGAMAWNFLFIGMAEELAFRGVIQGYLLRQWGDRAKFLGISYANWVASILFAYTHNPTFNPEYLQWFISLLPAGIFYGLLRERTGSWLVPGIAHGMMAPVAYVVMAVTGLEWKD